MVNKYTLPSFPLGIDEWFLAAAIITVSVFQLFAAMQP